MRTFTQADNLPSALAQARTRTSRTSAALHTPRSKYAVTGVKRSSKGHNADYAPSGIDPRPDHARKGVVMGWKGN